MGPILLTMGRKKWYRSCISLVLVVLSITGCLLHAIAGTGDGHHYIGHHFTINNGLPQNSVHALEMDSNGFLWIATQGGLCRFDGSRFAVYNSRNSILPLDRVKALTLDADGHLQVLLAKPDQRIYRIDKAYRLYPDQRYERLGFVFYSGYPAVKVDGTLTLRNSEGVEKSISGASLWNEDYRCFPVDNHRFYFVEKNALQLIDVQARTFRTCGVLPDWKGRGVLVGDYFLAFDPGLHCRFWKEGVAVPAPVTPAFKTLLQRLEQDPNTNLTMMRGNTGRHCLLRFNSEIWKITLSNGLLDARLLTDEIDKDQIVSTMLYDEQNRVLFVGTYTDGLYVYQENDFETILYKAGEPAVNNIYTQLVLNDHSVVNGYFRFDPFKKTTEPLPAGFHPATRSGFYRSATGDVWYFSDGRIHVTDSNLHPLRSMPFTPGGHFDNMAFFIADEAQVLWIASGSDIGHVQDGHVRLLPETSEYLYRNNITCLFSFDKGQLWLGTENGILPCDKKTGRPGKLLLPGNSIKCIFRAKDGSIWVSTYGKGLYKYERNRFIALPLDAGEHLLFAHSFNEDERGFFWIPTNNGLFQCQKAELEAYVENGCKGTVYYYHHRNIGKYTDEFNGGGNSTAARCGNLLLLPGMRGILSFDPLAVKPLLPNKVILIEQIKSDDQLLPADTFFSLSPGFRRLRIGISAPYFGSRVNNVLEYRLMEVGPDWYPVIDGAIVYNQLPRGSYHLTVRKRTGFGSANYVYHHLTFEVRPYWYQTWWFRIMAVFIVAATIFYFVKRRIRYLQRTKQRLEKMVTERTLELQETIAVLDSSEQELSRINKIQDQAMAIILHDIRSPLHYLSLSTRFFNEHIHTLSDEEMERHAASIMTSTDRIDKFANELVAWLHLNRDTWVLTPERVDLNVLFGEIKALYSEMARQKNNLLLVETVEPGIIEADKNMLHLILRNLVDNANKYCSDGRITIGATWTEPGKKLRVQVMDTGSGIPEEDILRLQQSPVSPDLQYGKLGLALVHHFLKLLNGKIEIGRKEGTGTVVAIVLDLQ